MSTYIYSVWKNSPANSPLQFYSELDGFRYETRKIEIFQDGKLGYASKTKSYLDTMLGVQPVPSVAEIMSQSEFDVEQISKQDFEAIWTKATHK